jgi:Ca2+-binding RTX toxin-like protein
LYGGFGDDLFVGGAGTDTLGSTSTTGSTSCLGNDTYRFDPGYGNDSVIDLSGNNVLWYTGISNPLQLQISAFGSYNVTITNLSTNEQTRLQNFCSSTTGYRNYIVRLSNGAEFTIGLTGNDYYLV